MLFSISRWLHIRGVGEWTNRLYSYFEKEQARLHSGEILPSITGSGGVKPVEMPAKLLSSTPQRDFLAKNLAQMNPSPIAIKARPVMPEKQHSLPTISKENEIDKKENPFTFDVAAKNTNRSDSAAPQNSTADTKTQNLTQPMKLERQTSESNSAIRKIQATLQRTFSRKGNLPQDGYANDGFVSDETTEADFKVSFIKINFKLNEIFKMMYIMYVVLQSSIRRKLPLDRKGTELRSKSKTPLEKSLSMPDMETRMRKRDRIRALREYNRSESERSFDETQMKKAHMKSLGLAYLSPQNRSLAQSFRYMRNKPTIIAFKTPSLENCEQRQSQNSMSKSIY